MKTIPSLTKLLEQWRRPPKTETTETTVGQILPPLGVDGQPTTSRRGIAHPTEHSGQNLLILQATPEVSIVRKPYSSARTDQSRKHSSAPEPVNTKKNRHGATVRVAKPSPVSLVMVVVCLTGAIGNRFYNQPQLDVGTRAPATIHAPEEANVPDQKTTEENRQAARVGAVPMLMMDNAVNDLMQKELQRLLGYGDRLRVKAGSIPFIPTDILSIPSQRYLRRAHPWEWLAVLAAARNEKLSPNPAPKNTPDAASNLPVLMQWVWQNKPLGAAGREADRELRAYRAKTNSAKLSALINQIAAARSAYAEAMELLLTGERSTIYQANFLDVSDADWSATKKGIEKAASLIRIQGIAPGVPKQIQEKSINAHVQALVPESTQILAVKILLEILDQPNLTPDPEATRIRAEQAAEAVETVMIRIKAGEVIVSEGEVITQADFVLLDHFGLSKRGVNWTGLLGLGVGVSVAVGIFWGAERRFCTPERGRYWLRRRDHLLILLLSISTPLLVALSVPWTSLPAIGLLVGSFYGSGLGATAVGLLALLLPIGLDIELTHLLASAAGGLVGGAIAGRTRSREELAFLGLGVGLTQGVVHLVGSFILSATAGSVWYAVLAAAALQSLAGLAWSVIALGISPYLEQAFDLITPVRLAELSNPNRPTLKRLAAEAPGTFQHTLFVATLAEAAAKELGCNVELVRAGTLYHDIGKMHDPLGFIENQMGGPNKHDEINDPYKSAEIIKKHVTEGLVMAKKCRLPKAIQAFIPEHQGTMLISYFYHQAQQRAAEQGLPPVQESDFRYDGPIPQSRETAILMLADSCEAALRSLQDATAEEALNMVNKILRARWQDNQLVDSGLKREEMPKIAEIFVRVWQQFHHKRIAYPKAALQPKGMG
ncbi:MAG TPA: HDIG domain-containing protein [Oscillatoriaceae cyanobacterium M33_DOE_052]|uniref:HDIG domain-containing protein n=1 Tax=Planktothricoides sp. SpSt-374 TaxID=2282167 RepID=A0A7C3ZYW7_9CYAN|nr:HDIG domain-containing protein [Oscillatoriaceae cyanobacterium M33_DOE_052]